MAITASLVKELRIRTGVGMMECKKALQECDGDIEKAAQFLRKSGLAKADKKSGRVAAEGIVVFAVSNDNKSAAVVEVNSETDFLAKADDFINFAGDVANAVLQHNPKDLDTLNETSLGEYSVEASRQNLITKLGENITVRRFTRYEGDIVTAYSHVGKIVVIIEISGGDATLAKDIAMHIAAMKPIAIDESGIAPEILAKEKEIITAQVAESGKPPNIIEKMTIGKMKKFVNEVSLLGQAFVKDTNISVAKLLTSNNAKVIAFERFEVGEGIEKKQDNFAEEVMAQIS